MRRWHWFAIAVVIAAPLTVAGLLPGPGHPAAGGTSPDPRPFGAVSSFSGGEHRVLHQATEQLISECMRARHQEYRPVPAPGDDRATTASPYSLLDPGQARTDGYGITATAIEKADSTTGNDEVVAALPAPDRQRWHAALTGTRHESVTLPDGAVISYATDGCVFLAGERLYGAGWTRLSLRFQGFTNAVVQATLRDADVVRATARWSDCMHDAGHAYTTLDEPRAEVAGRVAAAGGRPGALREAGAFELRVARRDASCQRHVRLPESVAAAQETAEHATLTEEDRTGLHRLRTMRSDALARAAKHVAADSDY